MVPSKAEDKIGPRSSPIPRRCAGPILPFVPTVSDDNSTETLAQQVLAEQTNGETLTNGTTNGITNGVTNGAHAPDNHVDEKK